MRIGMRLDYVVAAVLAAGCTGIGTKDSDTGTPALDDVACLGVPQGDTCPDEAGARAELVGDTTCESPVREVVATGAFVSSEDVVYTGYGGWNSPGDSGVADTAAVTNRCCYEAAYIDHPGEDCTIGRPVLVDGAPCVAPLEARSDWASASGGPAEVDPEAAAWWARQGQLEHASVAAFGQLVLDLLRLGAPASLVDRAGAALRDEVRHAEACFALAARFGGAPVGPGRLPVPAGRSKKSLTRLAVEAWREGCLGETGSVGVAAAQLAGATDPEVRRVVAEILADESRHAELSWDLVAWAVEVGGARVKRAVARSSAGIAAPTGLARSSAAVGRGVPDAGLVRAAVEQIVRDVVTPGRAALLAA
jgi:hypothetical protein